MKQFWALSIVTLSLLAFCGDASAADTVEDGKTVKIHYTMRVAGEIVDTTREREPLQFVYGQDPIMPGLQSALLDLEEGEQRQMTLPPAEAFGEVIPEAVVEVPKGQFENDVEVGMIVTSMGQDGQPIRAIVKEVQDEVIFLDFNHPLAGKELEIDFEIIEVS